MGGEGEAAPAPISSLRKEMRAAVVAGMAAVAAMVKLTAAVTVTAPCGVKAGTAAPRPFGAAPRDAHLPRGTPTAAPGL